MKRILSFFIITVFIILNGGFCFAEGGPSVMLRSYDGVQIAAGTFIPVINSQEISTEYSDTGSKVKFIATNDMYISDVNVLPQGTEFYGFLEKVNEPIKGTNGSMTIKINQLKFKDGYEMAIEGYIYTQNNNLIGGEITDPLKYEKMPIYFQGYCSGLLIPVPGVERKMGQNTVVRAGANMVIVLKKPLLITHTLTD